MAVDTRVEVHDLHVNFEIKRALTEDLFSRNRKILKAVDGVSFAIGQAETLSLVGESGSGKTTTGKAILQLVKSQQGSVHFQGEEVRSDDRAYMKRFRQQAQMIFQDPYQSVNPRELVMDIVAEPLEIHRLVPDTNERQQRIQLALEQAGLKPAKDFYYRYPHELSGGQRQRVALAAAIIMQPEFIVADEPVSMLDASIRTGILRLMMELQQKQGLSYLFITHDLSLAWLISDRIAIMYLGRIMEIGSADEVIHRGVHPYTRALTAIMPTPGVKKHQQRPVLPGETPDPTDEIKGCKFQSRCPIAKEICVLESPGMTEVAPGHLVACLFAHLSH